MNETFKTQKFEIDKTKIYGHLQIIEEIPISERPKNRGRAVKVKCSCGNEVVRNLQSIKGGRTTSCGCIRIELQNKKRQENILKNYINKKFGRLTILSLNRLDDNYGKTNWNKYMNCKCDCGKEVVVLLSNLNAKKTQSCGCLSIDTHKSKNPWNLEWRVYKYHCADSRLLQFNIEEKDFITLVTSKCHYCGSVPQTKTRAGKLLRNGIDRINYSLGYELSNCVPCCFTCNKAKGKMSYQEFLNWINSIKNHIIPQINIRTCAY